MEDCYCEIGRTNSNRKGEQGKEVEEGREGKRETTKGEKWKQNLNVEGD